MKQEIDKILLITKQMKSIIFNDNVSNTLQEKE